MLNLDFAADDTRNIEQVFCQPGLPRHCAVNRGQGLFLLLAVNSMPNNLHSPYDTLKRRSQLMRNHRQEMIFGSIGRFGLGPGLLRVPSLGLFKGQQFVELERSLMSSAISAAICVTFVSRSNPSTTNRAALHTGRMTRPPPAFCCCESWYPSHKMVPRNHARDR